VSLLLTGIRDQLILDTLDPYWFWDRVDVRSPDECWPWLMGCSGDGYGTFRLPNIHCILRAHRVALLLKIQHPLNELHALHHCDNPPCCNPLCLWSGTNKDNVEDCIAKGRQGNHTLRFTGAQQAGIRRSYAYGLISMRGLAKRHKVSTRTIQDIIHRTGGYAG
jgi:hypothetical protein